MTSKTVIWRIENQSEAPKKEEDKQQQETTHMLLILIVGQQ